MKEYKDNNGKVFDVLKKLKDDSTYVGDNLKSIMNSIREGKDSVLEFQADFKVYDQDSEKTLEDVRIYFRK